MKLNKKIFSYFNERKGSGSYILQGGRRSGKTFAVCQRLLLLCYNDYRVVNVASMTQEQGRLGAYADMKTIITSEPLFEKVFTINISPREIRNNYNGSVIFFNSYQNSETAKGVACDYLFLNEANNFSEQQYLDLLANVRKAVFIDYNPNIEFWVSKFYQSDDILITTWRDNPFLTDLQKEYFVQLKERAFSEEASSMDKYLYEVYYLGKHAEAIGTIFTRANILRCGSIPADCEDFYVFCDPSAMVGNDYFVCVFATYSESTKKIYIIDSLSTNNQTREFVVAYIRKWCMSRDGVTVYIETNGIIGSDFYYYLLNSDIPVYPIYSRANKYFRILSSYAGIISDVYFVEHEGLDVFLEQVYDFSESCRHDDNIDCVNMAYRTLRSRLVYSGDYDKNFEMRNFEENEDIS